AGMRLTHIVLALAQACWLSSASQSSSQASLPALSHSPTVIVSHFAQASLDLLIVQAIPQSWMVPSSERHAVVAGSFLQAAIETSSARTSDEADVRMTSRYQTLVETGHSLDRNGRGRRVALAAPREVVEEHVAVEDRVAHVEDREHHGDGLARLDTGGGGQPLGARVALHAGAVELGRDAVALTLRIVGSVDVAVVEEPGVERDRGDVLVEGDVAGPDLGLEPADLHVVELRQVPLRVLVAEERQAVADRVDGRRDLGGEAQLGVVVDAAGELARDRVRAVAHADQRRVVGAGL